MVGFLKHNVFYLTPFNSFPNKPWFLHVCSTSLLKTLREKEKLLVTGNFSFSHSVFHRFEELSSFFINLKLLSANSFSLEESKICCLGNGYQETKILDKPIMSV